MHDVHGQAEHESVDLIAALNRLRERIVTAVARSLGVDRQFAEDVVQDATIAALAHGTVLKTHAEWFGYLHTAAKNRAMNVLRDEARANARVEGLADRVTWLGLHPIPEPAEVVAAQLLLIEALEDLDQLPAAQREAYLLRHCDGKTVPQISAALGLSGRRAEYLLRGAERNLNKLRREHEESNAYAFLALLHRRVRDLHAVATTMPAPAPAIVAVAATVAASVVTAFSTPGLPSSRDALAVTRRALADVPRRDGAPLIRGMRDVRRPVDRHSAGRRTIGAVPTPTTTAIPRAGAGVQAHPPCVSPLCPEPDSRGESWTVRLLGGEYTYYNTITPLCGSAPPPPGVTCQPGQDPDAYLVKQPPGQPQPGGNTWAPSDQPPSP